MEYFDLGSICQQEKLMTVPFIHHLGDFLF